MSFLLSGRGRMLRNRSVTSVEALLVYQGLCHLRFTGSGFVRLSGFDVTGPTRLEGR